MKKIKAFTLTELIVVMIISTIVVSIAFLTLSMVKSQIRTIELRLHLKKELVQLEKILSRDFYYYRNIQAENNNTLVFKNAIDSVKYRITKDCVIRNKDSFKLGINNTTTLLAGKKVKKGEIDAISFNVNLLNNRKTFIYTVKDAAFYLNK